MQICEFCLTVSFISFFFRFTFRFRLTLLLYGDICVYYFIIVYLRMSSSIISKCHNVVTWETDTCFEKAKVLNDFLNDISKSRNRDFCSRKIGEEEWHMMFHIKQGTGGWGWGGGRTFQWGGGQKNLRSGGEHDVGGWGATADKIKYALLV